MPVLKLCPQCGQQALKGQRHCLTHTLLKQNQQRAKDRERGYSTQHWQTLRRQALDAAHGQCQRCGLYSLTGMTVHINPALGGNHHIATIQDCKVLCQSCHGTVDGGRAHR